MVRDIRIPQLLLSRRQLLNTWCAGFGGLALNALLADQARGAAPRAPELPAKSPPAVAGPLAPRTPHFTPKAKRVIFLFMHGGPSHVDTFDPKPQLQKDHGKPLPFESTRVKFAKRGNLMKSPWDFKHYGQNGLPVSELFPAVAGCVDDICMIHSLCDTNVAHGGATMMMHTGSESLVRPSLGAWLSYGLGTENQNLPAYITICPTSLHGGVNNWGAAFLPSIYQGVPYGQPGYPNSPVKNARFEYMTNARFGNSEQLLQLELLRSLNGEHLETVGPNSDLDARIQSFELAFRMQTAAPEATDMSRESVATRKLYGLDDPTTEDFGQQCLLARRFAERGVRFIQCTHSRSNPEQWDQHRGLKEGHERNAAEIDRPVAGLLKDLKSRGMLDETLVLWGGEFGRTPTSEGKDGRDHHPNGFTMWMAGGGVKGGYRHGETDEYGYYAVRDKVPVHDLHATILYLLGLYHEKLTFKHDGREFRLTDVYGNVAHDIIA
jgi:hypothetical protein